jgi:glycosyltransferase involved in cell wall biosynthesis
MHIGLDISVLRIAQAGVLVYTRSMLEHLINEGTQHQWTLLDVLPLNPQRPMQADLSRFDGPNVRIVRCTGINRHYLSQHPQAQTGWRHQVARRLDRLMDRPWAVVGTAAVGLQLRAALQQVDIFHSSDQFLYAPQGAAAVLTIHDLTTLVHPEFHARDNTALHRAKERFAQEQADHIIAVSQSTKRDIVNYLHIPEERISVIYEAADRTRFHAYPPDQIEAVLSRYDPGRGGYLLSIGTLEPRKNYIRLIEAYAMLRQQWAAQGSEPPPLVIAGGQGWLFEDIRTAPARWGIDAHVHFLGKVPDADLPLVLAGATLFVYPSLYEGFGLPVLEALACGVPVVASHSSSLPEVLGDAGLACNPQDSTSIMQAMHAILTTPALAQQLRHAGPLRAAQFSWQRAARETCAVYERLHAETMAKHA